jgi:MFS family permease
MTSEIESAVTQPSVPGAAHWQDSAEVRSQQRRAVTVLTVAQVIGSFGMGASTSVGILLAEDIVHSEALAGIARTSFTLGAALLGVPLALLAMRGGRRPALGLGWTIAALGGATLILAATTGNALLLIVGMLMFGVGGAAALQTRFSATDLASPPRRGRTLSLIVWSGMFGSVLGPNLGVPGITIANALHLPPLSGAFVIAVVMMSFSALVIFIFLRPDPLKIAQHHTGLAATTSLPLKRSSFRHVLVTLWRIPAARFALLAVVAAHVSMVSLMTMTPVHMSHEGADLSLIGLTISVHVLGMFAFAPLVGWASDRFGPIKIIVVGQVIFIGGAAFTVFFGTHGPNIMIPLFLLGFAWSCCTIPGSALLSDAAPVEIRTTSQGVVDTSMNMIAALAALFAGPGLALIGFGGLAFVAVVVALPILAMAYRLSLTIKKRNA